MSKYIPDVGDIVWIDFDPQKGNEIQKHLAYTSPATQNHVNYLQSRMSVLHFKYWGTI